MFGNKDIKTVIVERGHFKGRKIQHILHTDVPADLMLQWCVPVSPIGGLSTLG